MPVAIVGAGCRFPGGVSDVGSLDRLLRDGIDAVGEVPPDRWSTLAYASSMTGVPGKTYSRWGGFLKDIDKFEPEAFGISAREAAVIDPQQRLLLEVAWDALQDAAIPLSEIAGSRTGVFVGISTFDYSQLQSAPGSKRLLRSFTALGTSHSIAANRLSYCLDARGPSFAVDTACSSALVALDRAVKSLRAGECETAIVGGVNVILLPDVFISFCAASMLSPEGRCKAFDASANGFVRGEGAGVVVLRTAATAKARGERVHAWILGSGINQDGRTTGLAMPNREAQTQLLREVYNDHRINPAVVGYVEAHGTGTAIGDRVEAQSLGEIFAKNRDYPLAIGSVKTNIGHLEAGSGMAGLLKAMLSLKHRTIYPSLHFRTPNPRIAFGELRLTVPTATQPWPEHAALIAGVNSFGFGGTNAHVILGAAEPARSRRRTPLSKSGARRPYILPLSARSEPALQDLAARFAETLQTQPADLRALCRTAATRRTQYDVRVCAVGETREVLERRLEEFVAGERGRGISAGVIRGTRRPLVFVFGGQGTQYAGMGLELMDREPVFRETVLRCDKTLAAHLGWSVVDEITRAPASSRIDETLVAQPALFTIQAGLAALWNSWGVKPDAVIGHSVGEVAAAWACGALSFDDACRVIAARARTMQDAERGGKMLAVALSTAEVERFIKRFERTVSIAAVNGPKQVTLSGEATAMDELARELQSRGVWHRSLRVSHAFHSAAMDSAEGSLRAGLEHLHSSEPGIRFVSTLTGKNVTAGELDAGYWWRNVREPVMFEQAARAVMQNASPVFLEVGPHPAVAGPLAETARALKVTIDVCSSLRHDAGATDTIFTALALLYTCGVSVDWGALLPGSGEPVDLPPHPWRRERYWSEDPEVAGDRAANRFHPLLGFGRPSAVATWDQVLDLKVFPWISDHRVKGSAVLPGAAYIELMIAAVAEARGVEVCSPVSAVCLNNVQFHRALFVSDESSPSSQVTVSQEEHTVDVHSRRPASEAPWTRNATAEWSTENPPRPERIDLAAIRYRCNQPISVEEMYADLRKLGLEYGPAFQTARSFWKGNGEALARIEVQGLVAGEMAGYWWHPVVLDACFQMSYVPSPDESRHSLQLPVRVDHVRVWDRAPSEVWCHFVLKQATEWSGTGDIRVFDERGNVLGELFGCRVQRASVGATPAPLIGPRAYATRWQLAPLKTVESPGTGNWVVFADSRGLATNLTQKLRNAGATTIMVSRATLFTGDAAAGFTVNPADPLDFARLLEALPPLMDKIRVLYLWSFDVAEAEIAAAHFDEDTLLSVQSPLHLIQVLAGQSRVATSTVAFVHSGSPNAVGVLGLGRVAVNELRDWRIKLIEFPEKFSESEVEGLAAELLGEDPEVETAWRDGGRYLPRLEEVKDAGTQSLPAAEVGAFRLESRYGASLEGLQWVPSERRSPSSGEVEIEVGNVAINFRDVLKCVGLYPASSLADLALGDECAGVITAIGSGVTGFRTGDCVVTCSPGCFRSHVIVPVKMLLAVPDGWEASEAATVPIAFLTAWYALHTVAHLSAGESVLIHSAAGGVGLAAIQLARRAGARVLATAGNDAKRDMLRGLGCELVMDSRSLEFAREINEYTNGRGVDVVLNSLAGEALRQSLSCLAPYGRFLEIGKRDLFANAKMGLWALRHNASFHAIDVGSVLQDRPEIAAELIHELRDAMSTGSIVPLPKRVRPASEVTDAFRTMSQGKHTGKLVIDLCDPDLRVRGNGISRVAFKPTATYVLSGGLGGFGLETAKWVVRRGGSHLVLLSRRSPDGEEAKAAVAELESLGAKARAFRCDVGNLSEVSEAMRQIATSHPPVRGVFHSAAVIDDAPLLSLDTDRLQRVLKAKAEGAWNLHSATRSLDLDHFVMFSSVSATVGNPGQANYAAANAIVEGIARHRRSIGLPGTAIAWSLVSDTGFAAQRPELMKTAARHGLQSSSSAEYLKLLENSLVGCWEPVVVGEFDWEVVGSSLPRAARGLLSSLTCGTRADVSIRDGGSKVRERLAESPETERAGLLREYVQAQVARIVGVSAPKINVERPIVDMGLDSLMGIELTTALEDGLAVTVSSLSNTPNVTVEHLVQDILKQLGYASGSSPGDTTGADGNANLVRVMRNGSSRQPLICFHPIGGSLRSYESLIAHVHAEIPVYGVTSRLTDGRKEFPTLDDMARAYTSAVRASVVDGPYRLFGFSLGGYLAARVAQELEAAGQEVEFVGIADCPDCTSASGPGTRDQFARLLVSAYEEASADLAFLQPMNELNRAALAEVSAKLIDSPERGPDLLFEWFSENGLIKDAGPKESLRMLIGRLASHLRLVGSSATLPVVRAPLAVWRASRGIGAGLDVWRRAEGLHVSTSTIDADHATLMKAPAVLQIAQEINRACGGVR